MVTAQLVKILSELMEHVGLLPYLQQPATTPYLEFYVHGTVHRNSVSINVQQDATIHSLFYV